MVEEGKTQKDITIQLLIKSLTVPVTEQLPVKIIWTRGTKKAETKKRLLSDQAQSTVFDEKFEVSTQMEVDANGKPTRPKNSQLVVASDKAHGIIGKANLDLSKFGIADFETHQLYLTDCEYEGAFIEVRLKGAEKRRQSTKNNTNAATSEDIQISSSIMKLQEDMDKLQKEQA